MSRLDRIEALCDAAAPGDPRSKTVSAALIAREVAPLLPLLRAWAERRATAMAGLDGDGMDAEEWLRRFTEMWDAEGTACDALLAALRDSGGVR